MYIQSIFIKSFSSYRLFPHLNFLFFSRRCFFLFLFHPIYLFKILFYINSFSFYLFSFQSFASSPNLYSFLLFILPFSYFLSFFYPFFSHLTVCYFVSSYVNSISSCSIPSYHIYFILVVVAAAAVVRVNFPFRPDSYAAFVELRMYVEYCTLGTLLLLRSLLRCMQSVACLHICLSICVCVCLSICVCICLSICVCVCLPIYLSVCLPICLYICLSVYLYICLSICLSVCPHICLSAYISFCLFVCLSEW